MNCPEGYTLAGGVCVANASAGGGGGPQIQYTALTVTAAQINSMFAAPLVAVPAQGAGTVIFPVAALFSAIFGSAPFTGGGNIGLFYGVTNLSTTLASGVVVPAFLTGLAANQSTSVNKGGNIILTSPNIVNQPLYLSNVTAAFAGGAGCSMMVTIQFFTVPNVQ